MAVAYGAYSSLVSSTSARPCVRAWTSRTNAWVFPSVRSPGTTASTRRCSASKATWSQWSPRSRSSGSVGSQCFSFLATKLHFSSSWISRVRGGKSHHLVMEVMALSSRHPAVAGHGVLIDLHQATGGAGATPFAQVFEDGEGLGLGQAGLFQRGSFAFGVGPPTGSTVDHANPLARPTPAPEIQITFPSHPVVDTGAVLTTKMFDRMHAYSYRRHQGPRPMEMKINSCPSSFYAIVFVKPRHHQDFLENEFPKNRRRKKNSAPGFSGEARTRSGVLPWISSGGTRTHR